MKWPVNGLLALARITKRRSNTFNDDKPSPNVKRDGYTPCHLLLSPLTNDDET
jgi:hypothetical protein